MEKIILSLPADAWHGHSSETVWAEKVGSDRYRLRSIPFFAKGLSLEDVVTTRGDEGKVIFDHVSIRGGHSTYRVFLAQLVGLKGDGPRTLWKQLEAMGCSFERATDRLFAIDVPRSADLGKAYSILQKGESLGLWSFEEGYAAI